MPRIRKKTSKRGTTNHRRRIQQKVRESRKKNTKEAKKNTQWKSKHKKDPGIPSQFPYKDQVLAEIEESRRLAAESKAQRKAEKNALKQSGDDDEVEGVGAIHAKTLVNAKTTARPPPPVQEEDSEGEDVPMLVNPDLPNLSSVLDEAEAVIEVLDCRDPLSFRSLHIEGLAKEKGKKLMLVLTKTDDVPKEAVSSWLSVLRQDFPNTFAFRSASPFLPSDDATAKAKGKQSCDDALGGEAILSCLSGWASEKKDGEDLTVAVVGLTNAGKSSFVNSILQSSIFTIYTLASSSRGPTTTVLPQELSKDRMRVIDTPGLLWDSPPSEDGAIERAKDILLRNKGRIDRLKDPNPCIDWIVKRATVEDLMLLYKLPAFERGSSDRFLTAVARAEQLVKKKGALDLAGAAKIVLRSWSTGKTRWYTMPPSSDASESPSLTEEDEKVLRALKSRKEMRKLGGLVKMQPGKVDERKIVLEEPYGDNEDREEEDEEDAGDVDGVEDDGDEEDEGEEDDDEDQEDTGDENEDEEEDEEPEPESEPEPEPEPLPPLKGKRKRANADLLPAPAPKKKVAFEKQVKTKVAVTKTKPKSIPAAAKPKQKKVEVQWREGEEAYDFGKFF